MSNAPQVFASEPQISPSVSSDGPPRIEDHALIGDMRTAALVTKGGAIDWLCLPAFDSDACFAALLGTSNNGHWTIAPAVPVVEVQRRYRKNTLILETDFITEQGTVRLVDFMLPQPGRERSLRCRSIQCVKGAVPVRSDLSPIHWLSRNGGQHYSSRFRIVCEVERNFE